MLISKKLEAASPPVLLDETAAKNKAGLGPAAERQFSIAAARLVVLP
jgi:hypothetical protein